jgi:hypothetical protein
VKAKYPHVHIPDPGFNLTGQKCYIFFQHNQKFRMRVRSAKPEVLSCQSEINKVKTLYNAKLDNEFLIPLKEKYSALFEKPEKKE